MHDAENTYDREKALLENRNTWLEKNRDDAKRELEEASTKFQTTVEQLRKVQSDSKAKSDTNHSAIVAQMEAKYGAKMRELQDMI